MKPHPEDSNGWIITLDRRQKKQFVQRAAQNIRFRIEGCISAGLDAGTAHIYLEFEYRRLLPTVWNREEGDAFMAGQFADSRNGSKTGSGCFAGNEREKGC